MAPIGGGRRVKGIAVPLWPLGGQYFEQVTIRVAEIETAAALAVIDLHVLRGARPTAIGKALPADPVEDPVKLRLADLEGVMVPLEAVPIVEVDRQCLVDPHRSEMGDRALVFEAKNPSEEPRRLFLVAGRNDRVVEDDGQERLLSTVFDKNEPAQGNRQAPSGSRWGTAHTSSLLFLGA